MCVLRDEKCEALVVDATPLKEPLEFLLQVKIGSFELGGTYFECPRSTTNKKQQKTRSHLRTDVETAALPVGW
jgi:hypothetical protein